MHMQDTPCVWYLPSAAQAPEGLRWAGKRELQEQDQLARIVAENFGTYQREKAEVGFWALLEGRFTSEPKVEVVFLRRGVLDRSMHAWITKPPTGQGYPLKQEARQNTV